MPTQRKQPPSTRLPAFSQPREVTIFFSDIEGFTSLAEVLPPAALLELLSEVRLLLSFFRLSSSSFFRSLVCSPRFVRSAGSHVKYRWLGAA